jgi:ABC-type transport system involved in multi-copper enzyme maturation permease subunit
MTITVTVLLGWIGFYLVKGSVSRDYETGVGQIMATTPLSRPLYTLGKWFSNFAVLGIMIFILAVVGIFMNLLVGVAGFDLWALVSPLLLIALHGAGRRHCRSV